MIFVGHENGQRKCTHRELGSYIKLIYWNLKYKRFSLAKIENIYCAPRYNLYLCACFGVKSQSSMVSSLVFLTRNEHAERKSSCVLLVLFVLKWQSHCQLKWACLTNPLFRQFCERKNVQFSARFFIFLSNMVRFFFSLSTFFFHCQIEWNSSSVYVFMIFYYFLSPNWLWHMWNSSFFSAPKSRYTSYFSNFLVNVNMPYMQNAMISRVVYFFGKSYFVRIKRSFVRFNVQLNDDSIAL